jgi:hypothetical protein
MKQASSIGLDNHRRKLYNSGMQPTIGFPVMLTTLGVAHRRAANAFRKAGRRFVLSYHEPTWMARHPVTWHGTRNGYDYHDCRCEACKRAYAIYHAAHRISRQRPASPEFTGKPVSGGRPAPDRRRSQRLVLDGERRYVAYSLDELIELDSLATHGRPGHLFG